MGEHLKRLKELRLNKKISQKDIAEYLGITVAAYSLYERGKREPNLDMLKKIAEYFNVSIDYLMEMDRIEKVIQKANEEVTAGEIPDKEATTKQFIKMTYEIAATFDESEYTPEELEKIKEYAAFIKSNRK